MQNLRNLYLWLAPVALLLLVAIAYREAPNNTFHFDDEYSIVRHPPVLMTELTPDNLLNAGKNAFLPRRPLPSITFAVDWWRGGGSARSFQYTNLVIHGATTVAVFALLILVLGRLGRPPWVVGVAAFLGAALWACHPIQVQGVTYIVQRMTSLAALFTILTVVFYILGRDAEKAARRWVLFVLAGSSWALGIGSKETAFMIPFLVLLAEFGVVRHGKALIRNRIDWAALSLPAVLAVLVVVDIVSGVGPLSDTFLPGYERRDFSLSERLLTQPRVIVFHFSQILWPLPGRFSLEHDFTLSTSLIAPVSTLFAVIAVVSWCLLGVWALLRQRLRVLGFLLLWVPATLLIESSFIALEMVFEHRMYLPSTALAGIVALGMTTVLSRGTALRLMIPAVCLTAICLLVVSTSQRVPHWRSELSLAEASVKSAPNSSRAWSNLANALSENGSSWLEIGPPMMKALELDPDNPLALHLYAIRLIELQMLDDAAEVLDRLAPHAHGDHSILNTMGMLLFEQGDFHGAVAQFEKAIELNRFAPEFRYNLALAYEFSGRCREAQDKWSSYFQNEPSEDKRAMVRARFEKQFLKEGGRCFVLSR